MMVFYVECRTVNVKRFAFDGANLMIQMNLFSNAAYVGYETKIMLVRDRGKPKVRLSSSSDVAQFVGGRLRNADREILLTISLDARNTVVGVEESAIGSSTQAVVCPREVFKAAILHNAQGIIVVHNHPSGDVSASSEDHQVKKLLREAGQVLGIRLLDFVIVGDERHLSFADEGILEMNTTL